MAARIDHPPGFRTGRISVLSGPAHSTPARCVQLSHNPSAHVYHTLKLTIERSNAVWMREFLELDGLGSLVEAVEQLSSTQMMDVSDAILLLDCLACVRATLNSSVGMAHFLSSENYTRKLVKGLSSASPLAKKQVIELLTAVCVHSNLGYKRILDSLYHFQRCTNQTSIFSVVLSELKMSDTPAYRTTLLAFINTVLACTEDMSSRCSMRRELIGNKLLDMMHHFRREGKDADLAIQLEVFSVAKHKDVLEMTQNYKLDPNNHQNLFHSIYQEVTGTADSGIFLGVLQDFYLMTSSNNISGHLWKAIGKAVHHICSMSTTEEADDFVGNLEHMTSSCSCNKGTSPKTTHDSSKTKVCEAVTVGARLSRLDSGISMGTGSSSSSGSSPSYYDNAPRPSSATSTGNIGSGIRPAPGGGPFYGFRPKTRITENDDREPARKMLRAPSKPLKKLKWTKVPKSDIKKEVSLWSQGTVNRLHLDYTALEKGFSMPPAVEDDDEVELLTGTQSVALNVYLSRIDMSPEELVGYLQEGDDVKIGLSGLRYLKTVLPSHEEIMQLLAYKGEHYDLGQAEQLLLMLAKLPDYRALLAGLLFKAEFSPRYHRLKAAFSAMISASRSLLHHQGLKDFLFLVLDAGNYVNHGSLFGGAMGFKLSSLERVAELQGEEPGNSLLDHLIMVADAQNDDVTMFAADIPLLENAASHDLEEMKTEVTQLSNEMRQVLTQLACTHPDVKATFEFFIEDVKQDLQQLQDAITQLRSLSQQVALYFCENEATFRLHIALKQVYKFCEAVKKSVKDGIYRRQQQSLVHKRQEEMVKGSEMNGPKFNKQSISFGPCLSFRTPQTERVVDGLLGEVHAGHIATDPGDALRTPDLEWDPLGHVSHIEPASPLEEEVALTLALLDQEDDDLRMCLPDRIEGVLHEQYRKERQVLSSSFLGPSNSAPKTKGPLASPDEFTIEPVPPAQKNVANQESTSREAAPIGGVSNAQKQGQTMSSIPTKPEGKPQAMVSPRGEVKPPGTRTTPDNAGTGRETRRQASVRPRVTFSPVERKEPPKKQLRQAKEPEEVKKRRANPEPVMGKDTVPIRKKDNAEENREEKKKKRSSLSLLQKISRALKPKNTQHVPPKAETVPKKAVRPKVLPLDKGKENANPQRRQTSSQVTNQKPRQEGQGQPAAAPSVVQTTQAPARVTSSVPQHSVSSAFMSGKVAPAPPALKKPSSNDADVTSVEEVHEEPLYKIVVYQKYSQSHC